MSTAACELWAEPKGKVISLSSNTNAHIGNNTAYPDLVLCCKTE